MQTESEIVEKAKFYCIFMLKLFTIIDYTLSLPTCRVKILVLKAFQLILMEISSLLVNPTY